MKKILILLLATCSLSFAATKEQISHIRAHYNKIESAKDLTVKKIQADDELNSIVRYTNKAGVIVKQTTQSGSDHGVVNHTAYFLNGEIFFIFTTSSFWSFDPSSDPENPGTIDTLREERRYYVDNQCIRSLEKEITTKNPEVGFKELKSQENKEVNDSQRDADILKEAYSMLKIQNSTQLESHFTP